MEPSLRADGVVAGRRTVLSGRRGRRLPQVHHRARRRVLPRSASSSTTSTEIQRLEAKRRAGRRGPHQPRPDAGRQFRRGACELHAAGAEDASASAFRSIRSRASPSPSRASRGASGRKMPIADDGPHLRPGAARRPAARLRLGRGRGLRHDAEPGALPGDRQQRHQRVSRISPSATTRRPPSSGRASGR